MQASRQAKDRSSRLALAVVLALACGVLAAGVLASGLAQAQATGPQPIPIAIVPMDASARPGEAATVAGALEVTAGRTMIAASGSVTAGTRTARVLLPRRGEMRVCAHTLVKLAADGAAAADSEPGLLLAFDHGALELSLAGTRAARNSDVLMTPDFRILLSGPGAAEVKVRLGEKGDTCIDNVGVNAPYVLVSSVFEGGAYRVQAGQRVSFQHGSLHEVVDEEKEPCGCPPEQASAANEFPLAQSEGIEPLPPPVPSHKATLVAEPLVREGADQAAKTKPPLQPSAQPEVQPTQPAKKTGFFSRVGSFFRKIFGAE